MMRSARLLLKNPLVRTEMCGSVANMRVCGFKRFLGSTKTLDDIVVTSKCAQVGKNDTLILSSASHIVSHYSELMI